MAVEDVAYAGPDVVRRQLVRNAVASDLTRAAAKLTGFAAEIAVFDSDKVFVANSHRGSAPHGRRDPWTEEESVFAGTFGLSSIGPDRSSFAIVDSGKHVVGSLSLGGAVERGLRSAVLAMAQAIGSSLKRGEAAELSTAILDNMRDAVVIISPDFQVTWANNAVASVFARPASEVVGQSAADLVHPDDLEKVLTAIDRITRGLQIYRVFVRVKSFDGRFAPVEVTGLDHSGVDPVNGLLLSLRHSGAAEELRAMAENNRLITTSVVSNLRDGVMALDKEGEITVLNDAARAIFGFDSQAPVSSLRLEDFEAIDAGGHLIRGVQLLEPCRTVAGHSECSVIGADSRVHHINIDHREITGENDVSLGALVVFSDVTAERHAANELRSQAFHDQLTGLPNRRQLEQRLEQLKLSGEPIRVAVSFVDIDGFKLVNDTHGHRYGDEVIRAAAQRLSDTIRTSDLLVRQGGDEFVAVHVGIDSETEALEAAERLRASLCSTFRAFNESFDLTASVGVAIADPDDRSPDELIQRADIALYAAKERGRNRVASFSEELAEAVRSEERQRRILRRALDEDRVVMHFQPLIASSTGVVSGYEALARVVMDDGSIVGPSAFMDALASSSLMWELDRRAFALSCEAAGILDRQGGDEPAIVACNFSGVSLSQRDFVSFVQRTIQDYGVSPGQICIEITESAAFDAGPDALKTLSVLTESGFGLALDDFGTGYSPLSHLRDLPITSVKVDRSFIANITEKSSERAIAEAVVVLARQLGLGVVAEGVESAEQGEHAIQLGFNTLQGWHYAAAMPFADALENWTSRPNGALAQPIGRTEP